MEQRCSAAITYAGELIACSRQYGHGGFHRTVDGRGFYKKVWDQEPAEQPSPEPAELPIPEDLREAYSIACARHKGHRGFVKGLIERIARLEAARAPDRRKA